MLHAVSIFRPESSPTAPIPTGGRHSCVALSSIAYRLWRKRTRDRSDSRQTPRKASTPTHRWGASNVDSEMGGDANRTERASSLARRWSTQVHHDCLPLLQSSRPPTISRFLDPTFGYEFETLRPECPATQHASCLERSQSSATPNTQSLGLTLQTTRGIADLLAQFRNPLESEWSIPQPRSEHTRTYVHVPHARPLSLNLLSYSLYQILKYLIAFK